MVQRGVALVLLSIVLMSALWYSQRRTTAVRVSGFLEADEIRVGSRVGGRVRRVLVAEGQAIGRGELLIELEGYDLPERLAAAKALLAQAEANYDRLRNGYRAEEIAQAKARVAQLQANLDRLQNGARPQEVAAAEAELRLAESEAELAETVFQRAERLLAEKAVSREQFDGARTELRVSKSRVEVRRSDLALLKEGARREEIAEAQAKLSEAQAALDLMTNGYRAEEKVQAQAAVAGARASVQVIERQMDELQIHSPVEGIVESMDLQPGDLVMASAPAVTLMDYGNLWVRAYVPEDRLGIALGDEFPITVDAYADKQFTGRVIFVARQGEFTPRNVQTPEERSKQVFRIKVKLDADLRELRPGMSADVWLDGEVAR
jgi:multidrug resistance efflux pump